MAKYWLFSAALLDGFVKPEWSQIMMNGSEGTKPNLQIVAEPAETAPTDEQLMKVIERLRDLPISSDDFEKLPDATKVMLAELYHKEVRDAEKRAESEKEAVFNKQVNDLNEKLRVRLSKPKPTTQSVPLSQMIAKAATREPTREERLQEMQKKYGKKLPECVFDPKSHEPAMGIVGALIAVKRAFAKDMLAADADNKVALKNKCDSLQRVIDRIKEVVRIGHGVDPEDRRNFCPPNIYKEVSLLLNTDQRLIEHCKLIETKEDRERREQQKAEAEAKRLLEETERAKVVEAIVNLMMTVDYLKSLGMDNVLPIAKRVAHKYNGSTPELKLKQAAREKCGGNISDDNRRLGIALAKAAQCSEEEIQKMFPSKNGEKKNKKDKKK